MKAFHNFSLGRKISIALCALFACVAFALGFFAPNFAQNSYADGDTPPAYTADTAKPYHEYTSLDVSLWNDGVRIYAGETTASDLKQNLSVKGAFVGLKEGTGMIALSPEEYTLSIKGSNISLGLNEPIVAAGVTEETVTLVVTAGTQTKEVSVTISEEAKPVYDGIRINDATASVSELSEITDDYTADSLKRDGEKLKVYGKVTGATAYELIANREFYTVTLSGALVVGATDVSVTVTAGSDTQSASITSVTKATMLAADLKVNPSYELVNSYYRKAVVENGETVYFSAFIDTMDRTYVMKYGLVLTVYYANSSKKVDFSDVETLNEATAIATSKEYISFGRGYTKFVAETDNEITVWVSPRAGAEYVEASLTLQFEASRVIAIKADRVADDQLVILEPNMAVTSNTVKNLFSGKVFTQDNSGAWSELATGYTLSGTLTPTATAIDSGIKEGGIYEKDITLTLDENKLISCKVPVKVYYRKPNKFSGTIDTIDNATSGDQKYLTPFNFDNLYTTLTYGTGRGTQAYLSDFVTKDLKEHFRINYYSTTGWTGTPLNISSFHNCKDYNVQSVSVSFSYTANSTDEDDWTAPIYFTVDENDSANYLLTLSKYTISMPLFDTSRIDFSSDASKTIAFPKDLPEEIFNALTVSGMVDGSTVAEEDISKDVENREFRINFKKAGSYTIRVTIAENLKDEVYFSDQSLELSYTVQVDKLELNLRLAYSNGNSWTYGNESAQATVTGVTLFGDRTFNVVRGDPPATPEPNTIYTDYQLHFIPTPGTEIAEGGKLNAGEYVVYVTAEDTDAYHFHPSPQEAILRAPVVTVEKKQLTAEIPTSSIIYDSNNHDPLSYLPDIGIVSGDTGIVSIQSLTDQDGNSVSTSCHAKGYIVKLEITIDGLRNYQWDDSSKLDDNVYATFNFIIEQRKLNLKITNGSSLGFMFGDDTKTLSPTLEYCVDASATDENTWKWETSKPGMFFAEVKDAEYYAADDFDAATGKPKNNNAVNPTETEKWNAGVYYVYYATQSQASDDANQKDYTLPTAFAEFTVERQGIGQVTAGLNGQSSTYDGNAKGFSIDKWNGGTDGTASNSYIFTWTLTGVQYDDITSGKMEKETALPLSGSHPEGATSQIPVGTSGNQETGVFSFTHAGTYKLVINLNDNYKWNAGTYTTSDDESVTFTYTIEQATMKAQEKKDPAEVVDGATFEWLLGFLFDGNDHKPEPTAFNFALTADNLTFASEHLKFYKDNEEITDDITEAGTYEVRLLGWNANEDGDYSRVFNYKLPQGQTFISANFTIAPSALKAPVMLNQETEFSVEYKGSAYQFDQTYITNWATDYLFGGSNSIVVYVVDSGSHQSGDGFSFTAGEFAGMTDVSTYTVHVYPAPNFTWAKDVSFTENVYDGHDGFSYTFEITRKTLIETDFDWGIEGEYIFKGAEQKPKTAVKPGSLLNSSDRAADAVKVNLKILSGTSDGTKAGDFTVTIAADGGLTGSRAFNYMLSHDLTSATITIKPRPIELPTTNGEPSSLTYTGNDITQNFRFTKPEGMSKDYVWDWSDIFEASISGFFNFGDAVKTGVICTEGSSFDVSLATLTVYNAGTYHVSFKLKNQTNFCWAGEGDAGMRESNAIVINRKEITAPALGRTNSDGEFVTDRTMQHTGGELEPTCTFDSVPPTGFISAPSYGTVSGDTSFTYTAFKNGEKPITLGYYYVKFSINGNGDNPLNYVWVKHPTDSDATNADNRISYVKEYAKYDYAAGNVSIYLNYRITQRILRIDFEIDDYEFGDNGYLEKGDWKSSSLMGDGNTTAKFTLIDTDRIFENSEFQNLKYTLTFWFYDEKGALVGIVRKDADNRLSTIEIAEDGAVSDTTYNNLNQFLPWSAGEYTYAVKMEFDGSDLGKTLEPLEAKDKSFEVSAREIEVSWSVPDESYTPIGANSWETVYDGNEHYLVAEVTNAPSKTSDLQNKETVGLVYNDNEANRPVNALDSSYIFKVTDLDNANFKLPATPPSANLKIGKREIIVKVTRNPDNITYGDGLHFDHIEFGYKEGSKEIVTADDGHEIVTWQLWIADKNQLATTNDSGVYDVGTYHLKPVAASNDYANNYIVTEDESNQGSFVIKPRSITIELKKESGTYQQDPISFEEDKSDYTVVWNNHEGTWRVGNDTNIFSIQLWDGNKDVSKKEWLPVKEDGYFVMLVKGSNTNYTLSNFDDQPDVATSMKLGIYQVTPKTLDANVQGNADDERKGIVYDAKNHAWIATLDSENADQALITYSNLEGLNLSANNVQWWIKGGSYAEWTVITTLSAKNVSESGTYSVKVTADNHTEKEFTSVKVAITKAPLTISVNFTGNNALYYGEDKPDKTVSSDFAAELAKGIYAVGGLFEGDTLENIGFKNTDSFSYTTSLKDGKKPVGKNYTTTFSSSLTADNYEITEKASGELHIIALPVTVTIKSQTADYWSLVGQDVNVLFGDQYYTIAIDGSVGNRVTALPNEKQEIATIGSPAFATSGNSISEMSEVGTYPIYVIPTDTTNYRFTIAVDPENANWSEEWNSAWDKPNDALINDTLMGKFEIVSATFEFATHFDFANESAKNSDADVATLNAWVYGIKSDEHVFGYDNGESGDQKIKSLPKTAHASELSISETVNYVLYFTGAGEQEKQIAGGTDLVALFDTVLTAGNFNAGLYRLQYSVTTDNYKANAVSRYFRVGKKALIVSAEANGTVYYGEEAKLVSTSAGLVYNGKTDASTDSLDEVIQLELTTTYAKGDSVKVGGYPIQVTKKGETQPAKRNNYEITIQDATLTIEKRPVTITILPQSTQFDFNKASGNSDLADTRKTLTFTAQVGGGLSTAPFYGVAVQNEYNNDTQTIIQLYTNALDGVSETSFGTQYVGSYPIFAAYADSSAQTNYAITVEPEFVYDSDAANKVEEFTRQTQGSRYDIFVTDYYNKLNGATGEAAGRVIGYHVENGSYNAGIYTITPANLSINTYAPGKLTYNGEAKVVSTEIVAQGYENEQSGIEVEYKLRGSSDSTYTKTAPVNVGIYQYRVVITNPNYVWRAPSQGSGFEISPREIEWHVTITGSQDEFNGAANYSREYLGIGNNYILEYQFKSLVEGQTIRLKQPNFGSEWSLRTLNDNETAAFNQISLAGTYSTDLTQANKFALTAQFVGSYTIRLELDTSLASGETFSAMSNYVFKSGNDVKTDGEKQYIEFTFTITQKNFNVTANRVAGVGATVQYGTIIDAKGTAIPDKNRFSGFELRQNVYDLATAETEVYFRAGTDYVTYTASGYDPAASPAGGTYPIIPSGVLAYNYRILYNQAGETVGQLRVVPRTIDVIVNGYDEDNSDTYSWARVIYNGENQQPDYTTYADRFFTYDANWYGAASGDKDNFVEKIAVQLYINNTAIDADTYNMFVSQKGDSNSNYKVTFYNQSGDEIGTTVSTTNPKFRIEQKLLTVQAVKKGTGSALFDITYGNIIEGIGTDKESYFGVTFTGWVVRDGYSEDYASVKNAGKITKEELAFQAISGDKQYKPWESHAGEQYIVIPSGLEFTNYTVKWENATMTVKPRLVTVDQIENRIYAEDLDSNSNLVYGTGASGRYHNAQIVFKDFNSTNAPINNTGYYYGSDNVVVKGTEITNSNYQEITNRQEIAPKYKLEYHTESPDAPTQAGDYTVTIVMNSVNGCYDFKIHENGEVETSVNREFVVEKQGISLQWDPRGDINGKPYLQFDKDDTTEKNMSVYFNSAIMEDDRITLATVGANGETETRRLSRQSGEYKIENGELTVNIKGIGYYSAYIKFSASAKNNYKWGNDDSAEFEMLVFQVSARGFTISNLKLVGWVYNTDANIPTYEISNGVMGVTLNYSYARLTGALPDGITANGEQIVVTEDLLRDFGQLSYTNGSPSKNTDAGIYLLHAVYPGSHEYASADAYLVFEIEKAEIERPKTVSADKQYNTAGQFNATIDYSSTLFDIVYDGAMRATGTGVVVQQSNQGTYTVAFRLKREMMNNYTLIALREDDGHTADWSVDSVNGFATFTWKIAAATDNEVVWEINRLEVVYSGTANYEPKASSTYNANAIVYEYNVDGDWTTDKPVNAGKYQVRAISYTDAHGNYNTAESATSIELTIARKQLTVTPSGSAEYGTPFSTDLRGFSLAYAGFVNGEDERVVTVTGVTYAIAEAYEKFVVKPNGYALTLNTKTDDESHTVADGLEATNYYITVANGIFTVTKRPINVVIGSVNATYGDALDLSTAKFTTFRENALVYGDEFADLKIDLKINSANRLPEGSKYTAGAYPMAVAEGSEGSDIGYDDSNYTVTFPVIGSYIVSPLKIRIEIEAGGGVYGGQIHPATVTGVFTTEDGKNVLTEIEGIIKPSFNFVYYGVSNDGSWNVSELTPQSTCPTLAGSYYATAQNTVTGNFTLTNSPTVAFTIAKQEIDGSKITTKNATYTGSELTPVINENEYEALYTMVPVTYTNVGTWDVSLKIKDFDNYKWKSVEIDERTISFTIEKGKLVFVSSDTEKDVEISGWTFGGSANAPSANTQLGEGSDSYVYYYSPTGDPDGDDWTTTVPTTAGTWYVRVAVRPTDNYDGAMSRPTAFEIAKAPVLSPELTLVTTGEGQNDTYTGGQLQTVIKGFDNTKARIVYNYEDGFTTTANGDIALLARNAGTYTVSFVLSDASNYRWAESVTLDENGNALLAWTVARKKLDMPTNDTRTFIVNGGVLRYNPVGFDAETMEISGNEIGYGGSFKVTVSIKDKLNFEWANGSTEDIIFDWSVVGWDTIFIIVVSSLGVIAGIAAIAIGVQYLVHRRKKQKEAVQEAAARKQFNDDVLARAEANEANRANAEGSAENAEKAETAEEKSEEATEVKSEQAAAEEGKENAAEAKEHE